MVAAARLRRAQERVDQATPYAKTIYEILGGLRTQFLKSTFPLLQERNVKNCLLVVFSSDRGLCGAFNSGLFRRTEKELQTAIPKSLMLVGRKAHSYFSKKSYPIYKRVEGFWGNFSHEKACQLAKNLADGFVNGEFDQVEILYNEFTSVISQKPKLLRLIPFEQDPLQEQKDEPQTDFIYEPDKDSIIQALMPKAIEIRFYLGCLNSLASEYGARMTAMDSATRNAGDMIDSLTLNMNRARQANITRELVEIISGAEAIK